MSSKRLLKLIKNYKDNRDVKVDVYFSDGQKKNINDLTFERNSLILGGKKRVNTDMISHAEIYSV